LSGLWDFGHGFGFYRGALTKTGIEWSPPTIVAPAIPIFPRDKEAFTVDPNSGTIYLTYTSFDTSGIFAVRSDDQGQTWCPPEPVFLGPAQGSFPAVDNQGNLFVAYRVGLNSLSVSVSSDGAASFQPLVSFPLQMTSVSYVDRSSQFPQIAVDNSRGDHDGWVYLVWHGGTETGDSRIYISHSEDGGSTWLAPFQINSDATIAYRWWPSVSVDSNGSANLISLDRRNHPGTGLTDCFFAQSTDGGNSFTEIQVTDVTSSWEGIRHDPGFTYAGDYIRAVSQATSVYAVWTDPRNGDPDIYFSRLDAGGFAAAKSSLVGAR